jgi:hypothetical protein
MNMTKKKAIKENPEGMRNIRVEEDTNITQYLIEFEIV